MGSILSLAGHKHGAGEDDEVLCKAGYKRQKTSSSIYEDKPRLIPCLPDEISIQILARIPRMHYFDLRLVSRKWKSTLMSCELFRMRKELRLTEEWLYLLTKEDNDNGKLAWHALDPLSRKWMRLPPMPTFTPEEESPGLWLWNMVGSGIKIAEYIRNWLGHKDETDTDLFSGCAIGSVDGCLYVLGGFSRSSVMKTVWQFDPILNKWGEVSSMSMGRAYSKTAVLNNKLYVVGGVSRGQGGLLAPLQSAEAYDPCTGTWSEVPSMPFSRAQVSPNAFWAETLKPIATGMTSYMGRLYVSQSLYSWPFFVDVGGEIYDPQTNSWLEMPTGMGEGWPARQAGTKLSVVVDGELYAFDPSSSLETGKIKVYDQKEDAWKVVIGKVPPNSSADSESPYLLTGLHGKIHVITKNYNQKIAVMLADLRHDLGSSLWSSSRLSDGTLYENSAALDESETETVVWKVISSRDLGSAELVNCQVLDM